MKPRHTVLLAALLALPVAAGGDRIQNNPSPSTESTPAFSAGQVLILDGSAGKNGSGPAAVDIEAVLGDAISTSADGLVVENSPVPGGGKMVNLQGRFQNAMTISVDENGNVSTPCISGSPKTDTEVK